MTDLYDSAEKAKRLFRIVSGFDTQIKNTILLKISEKIKKSKEEILAANQKDLVHAQKLLLNKEITLPILKRLELNGNKIEQLSEYLENVAKLDDPVGKQQSALELSPGLDLKRVAVPIGLIAVIFESRPEVVIQVSALAIKSGNACILKGGSEAQNTNKALFNIINEVLIESNCEGSLVLIESREDVKAMLKLEQFIDLIIPRGSNSFVKYIQNNTLIPVIGHSSGICHIFVDDQYNHEMSLKVIKDSKMDYPSACNAVETLLIHQDSAKQLLKDLIPMLLKEGIEIFGCEQTQQISESLNQSVQAAQEIDWSTEYGDLKLSIKIVPSLEFAIDHINKYGSHHTDSIITEQASHVEQFMNEIDSACVFHNSSTRFSDGFVFGLGAEVGISTNKTHARGPVGLEGLMSYKYKLFGEGQLKGDFSGSNGQHFTHKKL